MYEEFADAFNLWECKLAIIDCAGYSDTNLMKFIWRNILQEAVNDSSAVGVDKMLQIFAKIKPLCRKYKNSANCFPLGNSYFIDVLFYSFSFKGFSGIKIIYFFCFTINKLFILIFVLYMYLIFCQINFRLYNSGTGSD